MTPGWLAVFGVAAVGSSAAGAYLIGYVYRLRKPERLMLGGVLLLMICIVVAIACVGDGMDRL